MAVLLSGAFVIILNQTLLNTALPAFMKDFGVSANAAQWVTTVFMLVNGIMIPATAFLIQRFTTRTMFFGAMGLFTVGTDRKSTRLNSSHVAISYAVFCLKKKRLHI